MPKTQTALQLVFTLPCLITHKALFGRTIRRVIRIRFDGLMLSVIMALPDGADPLADLPTEEFEVEAEEEFEVEAEEEYEVESEEESRSSSAVHERDLGSDNSV